jgi:hypothetical protein
VIVKDERHEVLQHFSAEREKRYNRKEFDPLGVFAR